jgi:hypothetical protein
MREDDPFFLLQYDYQQNDYNDDNYCSNNQLEHSLLSLDAVEKASGEV